MTDYTQEDLDKIGRDMLKQMLTKLPTNESVKEALNEIDDTDVDLNLEREAFDREEMGLTTEPSLSKKAVKLLEKLNKLGVTFILKKSDGYIIHANDDNFEYFVDFEDLHKKKFTSITDSLEGVSDGY